MLKEFLKMHFRVNKTRFLNNRFWTLTVTVLVLLHFTFLNVSPNGFNHDEIEKLMSAKSFIQYGTDISGVSFPQALISTYTQGGQNNLLPLGLSLIYRTIPINSFTSRLPFVLSSVLVAFILSRLVWKLSGNKLFAVTTLGVALINPWLWHLGRSITESNWALLFTLLGIWLLESNVRKAKFLAVASFFIALLSYWGIVAVLPIVVVCVVLANLVFAPTKEKKTWIVFLATFILLVAGYFVILINTKDSTLNTRSSELIFTNTDRYTKEVNDLRQKSIQTPLTNLVTNKATLLVRDITSKYLSVWSPEYLFVSGDPRATYRFGTHGVLYVLDLPFLVLGVIYLAKLKTDTKRKKLVSYLLILGVIAPLASSVSLIENSYVFRSILLLPVLIILTAAGITYLARMIPKLRYFILAIYLLYFANFLTFYLTKFPVVQQENQFWSETIVAKYLERVPASGKVTVITSYPTQVALKFLLVSNKELPSEVMDSLYSAPIKVDNIIFASTCVGLGSEGTFIVQEGLPCQTVTSQPYKVIQNFSDSGSLWKLYNDTVCTDLDLESYRGIHTFPDYTLDSLTNTQFCMRQIHQYD